MLFKMAAFFMMAAATSVQQTGNRVQWIYESGPNKGYVCAMMEKDGTKFDIFLPSESTVGTSSATTLTPVPWHQYPTKQAAENAIKSYCATSESN